MINPPRLGAVAWPACLIGCTALALRAHSGGVLHLDVSLARRVQSLPDAFDALFRLENWAGDGLPLVTVTLVLALGLLLRRHHIAAVVVMLTFLARLGDVAVKRLASEPRPSPSLVHVSFPYDNLGFPSGHVIGVTLVYGLLFAYAPRLTSDRRLVLMLRVVAAVYIATIGLARVWVGAHWPSDVAGGYLYAALWLIPALVLIPKRLIPKRNAHESASRFA